MRPSDLTKKAGWVTTGDIIFKAMSFVISIYLARMLGVVHYGWITIGFSILGYAVWFTDLGLEQIGTRDAAKPVEKRRNNISTYFITRFLLSLSVIIPGLIILYLLNIPAGQKYLYMVLLCAALPHALLLHWYFKGRQQFKTFTLGRILQNGIYLVLLVTLLSYYFDPIWVGVAYLGGISISALFLIYKMHQLRLLCQPLPNIQQMISTIKEGLVIGSGNIMTQVVILLPPICIGYFLGDRQAGWYGVAFKLVLGGMMLDYIFNTLYLPLLTKATVDKSTLEITENLTSVTKIVAFVAILSGFGLYILAPLIIPILFGEAYAASILILQILCWFVTFTLINSVFTFGLIALGKDKAYFRSALWGSIISLFLILSAAWWGNIMWVAWAVTLSECIIMILRYTEFRRFIPVKTGLLFVTLFISIGLIEWLTAFFATKLIIQFLIGMLVIPSIFTLTKALGLKELRWMQQKIFY